MPKFFDVRGEWDAHQSNGFVVHFFSMTQVLRGSDPAVTNLSGKASHSSASVQGNVGGAVSGNQFHALVFWDNETAGDYSGTFSLAAAAPGLGSGAAITGLTYDQAHVESQATWYTTDTFLLEDF